MAERTHLTFAATTTVLTALLVAAGLAAGKAQAQEATRAFSQDAPVQHAAMRLGERMETADCRTAAGVEVAPVSFDELNAPEAWVIVERADGEPMSATRIDPSNTVLIRSISCGGDDWVRPSDRPAGS